jgi:membrane-bound lytic murein transglycosylase B
MINNRREKGGCTVATLVGWATLIALLSLLFIGSSHAEARRDFQSWLQQLRKEAAGAGVSQSTLQKTLEGIEPLPRVIELDRRQPEFTLTASDYLARTVTERRVQAGQEHLA